MNAIKREVKTEEEIRAWMNKELKDAGCDEYTFNELRKRAPVDIGEDDCNWTTAEFHRLHLSSSAETKDSAETKFIDCEGIASEIEARASSLFDME